MCILTLFISILATFKEHAIDRTPNYSSSKCISDEVIKEVADKLIMTTNKGTKKLAELRKWNTKDYKIKQIHCSDNTHIFLIKANNIYNVIKYVVNANENKNEIKFAHMVQHENIVEVYKTFTPSEYKGYFLIMEPMNYPLLIEDAKKHPKRIKKIVGSIINALKYLKKNRILYNNICFENILIKNVGSEKVYKLCDFTCANVFGCKNTDRSFVFRNNAFTPPEMYVEHTFDEKTDIWMLGRLIKFYQIGKLIDDRCQKSHLSNSAVFARYLLNITEKAKGGSKDSPTVTRCCKIHPENRPSYEEIEGWFS